MKKLCVILLCLSLLLSLPMPAFGTEDSAQPLLEVTLDTYSNKQGIFALNGLYRDNVLYIAPEDICAMTGATVDVVADGVIFRLHQGLRLIKVSSQGQLTETHFDQTVNESISVVTHRQKLYISAADILSYMGAVVGFGTNATAQLHMMVSMPYTVLDLMAAFDANGGYAFSWAEAHGKHTDSEDLLTLTALDAVLLGYDPNVIAYALPAYTENSENAIHTDTLLELLRTEGTELGTQEAPEVQILGQLSEDTEVSFPFLKKTLGWVEETKLDQKLAEKWSGRMDRTGQVVEMNVGCIAALEAARQFANLYGTQKTLLQNTLCRFSQYTDPYTRYPETFEAAQTVEVWMGAKIVAGGKAAWDQVYDLLGEAAEAVLPPDPIPFAFNTVSGITEIVPLTNKLQAAEKNLRFASKCSDIRVLADSLLAADMEIFNRNGKYVGEYNTTVQEYMKQDMILSLKASLTARRLLLDTGWLSDGAQNAMQGKAEQTARLLNMAQNARPTAIGIWEENEADISWIAKLAPTGSFGNVVTAKDYTYYWRYNEDSFRQTGVGDFQFSNAFNELIRRDPDGKEEVLFTLAGDGAIAIANDWLFYENSSSQICSMRLDGTEETNWGYGYLRGVTENGSHVIYSAYSQAEGNHLRTIDVRKKTSEKLVERATFVKYHDGAIYFTEEVEQEQAQLGKVRLCSIRPDGTGYTHLYTTEPDLYPYGGGFSAASVDQIRFTEDYVYFSYGSVAGSGVFFQGGRIVRVRYDGTDGQVVAGQTELRGGQFTVSPQDQVTSYPLESGAVHEMGKSFRTEDGNVYLYDQYTGKPVLVVVPGDYDAVGTGMVGIESDGSLLTVAFMEQVEGKVYYLMHEGVSNPDPMASWREPYIRNRTVMLMKDLQTGQVTVLFQC